MHVNFASKKTKDNELFDIKIWCVFIAAFKCLSMFAIIIEQYSSILVNLKVCFSVQITSVFSADIKWPSILNMQFM